ncbi:MAG: CaiB/BaiF CoA transferase family protein [Acidimicrobiia bacterium]
MSNGPLAGTTVVEFAGIGPGPFACSLLADLGALVVRVEKPGAADVAVPGATRLGVRRRLVIEADLKTDAGIVAVRSLLAHCDAVVEGFRPGVMERLGFGPEDVHAQNKTLVYVRISGWGQDGPYASMAGHDINYIGLSGVLAAIGTDEPTPPLNLIGDYAGGALFAVVGALAGILSARESGEGSVVDAAMVDGSFALLGPIADLMAKGLWTTERNSNLLDGGAPFYRTYRTQDDEYVAVGALEPAFYSELLDGLDLDVEAIPDRTDKSAWPELQTLFAERFAARTRSEWAEVFDGTDACVTPVLSMDEVGAHPHNDMRGLVTSWEDQAVAEIAPRMGSVRPLYRADADVSDTLVALGMQHGVANSLAAAEKSYWV